MQIVDSHCHLDRLDLSKLAVPSLDQVVKEAAEACVDYMLCVGIDLANCDAVVSIAQQYENIFASVGVHPCDVKDAVVTQAKLMQLAAADKVVAIGETGLDYHYTAESKAIQQESFALHLDTAKALSIPVIVHTREAKQDTLDIIKAHGCPNCAGVLHCFTEDWPMASAALDMGFYISFSGIVTFKNAHELKDVAKKVPLERILVETDSPYLAPVPFRGKANFPKHTRQVLEYIAELRGLSADHLATQTTENFFTLFSRANF
jgi:TatD DNase family protein